MDDTYDPGRLLDVLAEWLGAPDDRVLARLLQVPPRLLQEIRARRMPLAGSLLLSLSQCAGRDVDELRWVLGERRRRARMLRH